jgi:hypothetical protein
VGAGTRSDGVDADYRGTAYLDPPAIGALQSGPPLTGDAWTATSWGQAPEAERSTAPAHRCGIASALGLLALALASAARRQRREPPRRSISATRSGSPPAER